MTSSVLLCNNSLSVIDQFNLSLSREITKYNTTCHFLVRRDESPENYCHSPGVVGGVVVVVVVVRRQKL